MKNMFFARILFAALFMTFMGGSTFAQKQSNNLFLISNEDGDMYGFINSKGTVIVEPKYMDAKEFSEGMAAVYLNDQNLWGFINHTGKMVIPARYIEVSNFSEGVALVKQDGKWLLIDKNGKTVAKCKELDDDSYITVSDFHEGMAKFYADGKYGFINKQGKIAIRPSFENVQDFKNGLALVIMMVTENEDSVIYRIGYIDKKGNFVWSQTMEMETEEEEAYEYEEVIED